MKLSHNFTLREFLKSQTASRRGIDNSPENWQIENMRRVAANVLQPVRNQFGPTIITSGFRCLELNRAIGSSDSSQHTKGQAADFEVPGVTNLEVAQWVRDNLSFDQLILEAYDPNEGPNSGWIHCSFVSESENRGEVMTAEFKNGSANYYWGLGR
jgi:hypothetical protein